MTDGPQGVTTYSYDPHGNRTGAAYQYEPNKLRLSNQGGTAFTYDLNGNMSAAGTASYSYTPQNQLETATVPGIVATFAYDADDQRVKRTTNGGSTTYYVRGLNGELLTEWQDPGTATGRVRDYIYLGTRLLSAVAKNTTDDPADLNAPSTKSHRFAKSWQVLNGMGAGAATLNGPITAAARKSSHPDMPRTGLRIGVASAGIIDNITVGPVMGQNPEHPKQAALFLEFEVERYPFSSDAEWLGIDGGGNGSTSTDDLRLFITSSGTLVLKHDGARPTPMTLWTSAPVGLGTRHTLELRFEYNSFDGPFASPNPVWENLTSWAQVIFDGTVAVTHVPDGTEGFPRGLDHVNGDLYFQTAKLLSPGPANGLLMNLSRVGLAAATNDGDALPVYGTAWRTTLLEAAGPGTYSEWAGGQPDWRARPTNMGSNGAPPWVTTNVINQKISYAIESMVSRGITGKVGTVLVGVSMGLGFVSSNTRAFIRRNGVDTILTDLTLTAGSFRWYRVAQSGWAATDTIEVGVTSGDTAGNSLSAVALMVEHNTPEPTPLTDTTARVVSVNYIGNGGAQTVDFGIDQVPTVLFVVPASSAGLVEPLWWWDSRLGAAGFGQVQATFGRIWPQKGKFHAVHATTGKSYNANGVTYTAIALFDPSGRYVIPFAVSKPASESYTHELRYPQSGEPASDFTPDFVFGGVASSSVGADVDGASVYRGPGHVGDSTGKLGVSPASSASEPDRIQAIGAGSVQFGTALGGSTNGDQAFWAGRVDDGVSTTRLIAVTSYVGDGTASRNISLNLSGEAPVFALVVPTNATAKAYRAADDTSGRGTAFGSTYANSITALAANQITVGLALNTAGVTYDVWAITTGVVTP